MEKYWKMNAAEAQSSLGSSSSGLTSKDAVARLKVQGPNEIEKPDKKTPLRIFISQFQNPMIYILIGATAIAAALGDVTEALIICGILVVNAVLGFIQEYRSEKALEELSRYVSMTARTLRDGAVSEISVRDVVRGDIVLIAIGDIIPADARLIEVHGLEINESVLTGESNAVVKGIDPITVDQPDPYQMTNAVFMGSVVTAGSGKAVVFATGKDTFFGKSAKELKEVETTTDFERSIRNFGSLLVKVIIVMTIFVFIVNTALGHGWLESFLFALAIAVGITPELLPVIITIGLSDGALALVKKHVAVKRLQAIEDLGNIDVLCSDKTGTLTENQVSLIRYLDAKGNEDERVLEYSLLCNSAIVQHGHVKGGTIDSAIWTYALDKYDTSKTNDFQRIDEIPFDYERKRMSVVVRSKDGPASESLLITKGAPETMLPICTRIAEGNKEMTSSRMGLKLRKMAEGFGSEGYRVVVVACKSGKAKESYNIEDEKGLTFLGFLILMDPPKKDAVAALERFGKLGVEVYVLTGDGALVTGEICKQVGIQNPSGKIVLGSDIASLKEEELREIVRMNRIFARMTPSDKLAVVKALRADSHVVGFIGDGVNDTPALKAADVGISVNNGADIAKDAADVVLLRKSLNVVANGISGGRRTFANIIKYIDGTISANFGNMFTLTIASLFLPFIPLLPSQILFTNLLTDVPMLSISTDEVDKEDLKKPRRWDIGRISRFMIFFGIISSIFDLVTMGFVLIFLGADQTLFRTIWFLESVLSEIFVVFSIRTSRLFFRSIPSGLLIASSAGVLIVSVGVLYSPFAPLFGLEPLSPAILGIVFAIVLVYVVVVEIAKHIFSRRENNRNGGKNNQHRAT